jgi:hypothetical protein
MIDSGPVSAALLRMRVLMLWRGFVAIFALEFAGFELKVNVDGELDAVLSGSGMESVSIKRLWSSSRRDSSGHNYLTTMVKFTQT